MQQLPLVLQKEIIKRLMVKDKISLRTTCTRFMIVLDTHFLWLAMKVSGIITHTEFLPLLQSLQESTRKKIRKIDCRGDAQVISPALPYLRSLESLIFSAPSVWISTPESKKLGNIDSILTQLGSSLTNLDLFYVSFSPGALKSIPSTVTNLEISNPQPGFTLEGLPNNILKIELQGKEIDDSSLRVLSSLQKLQSLVLQYCPKITGDALYYFPQLMTRLECWFCKNLSDLGGTKHLTKLQYLDLTDTSIEDTAFSFLPKSLQSLTLFNNSRVTNQFLSYVNAPLTFLSMKGTFSYTEFFKFLPTSLTSLSLIDVEVQPNIVFPSQLKELGFRGCRGSLSGCVLPPLLRILQLDSMEIESETLHNVPNALTDLSIYRSDVDKEKFNEIIAKWKAEKRKIAVTSNTRRWRCWLDE